MTDHLASLLQLRLHEQCKHPWTSSSEEQPEQASLRASNSWHWWCVNVNKHRCCSTAGSAVIDMVCEVESRKGDSLTEGSAGSLQTQLHPRRGDVAGASRHLLLGRPPAAISNENCYGQATRQVISHSDIAKAWQAVLEPECSGISLCLNEFVESVLGSTWLGMSMCLNDIEYLLKVDAVFPCSHFCRYLR